MEIEIRLIQAAETWPLRHQVMWPEKSLAFVILPEDKHGLHYGLFQDKALISVISLFVNGSEGQFRKFATYENRQGKGYGTMLLKFLINECKRLNIKQLGCDARISAIGFYEKFGLKVCSEVFQKNEKDYVKMNIDL